MANIRTEANRYFKSHDFKKSILGTGLMVIMGWILYIIGWNQYIVALCVGILLTSFSDFQGRNKLRLSAMFLSLTIIGANALFINIFRSYTPLLIAYIGISSFFIAYFSVFGNRASLVTVSGLMSIVLNLIKHYTGKELMTYTLMLIGGGIAYIIVSNIYHALTKKEQINEQLGELAGITADFARLRLKAFQSKNPNSYHAAITNLQISINQKQEALRSLIISRRLDSGPSSTRSKQFIILIALIDIMELALANPTDLEKFKDKVETWEQYISPFIDNQQYQINALYEISRSLLDNAPLKDRQRLSNLLNQSQQTVNRYVEDIGLPKARQGALAMMTMIDYAENQGKKFDTIYNVLLEREEEDHSIENPRQFISSEGFNFNVWKENFNLQSPIFRHSVRLSLAMIVGYLLGIMIEVQNPYWILLTIVVILRPNYGLTKERSISRLMGTLVGVLIAVGIVYYIHDVYVFLVLAIISNVFAFSMLSRNYFISSIAVTLSVVFVFSILDSDAWTVIQYRLIDTSIGAFISIVFSYTLFPNWESKNIESAINNTLLALDNYLLNIKQNYIREDSDEQYRLARKETFIASSNLQSSMQNYLNDPESKRHQKDDYIQISALVHQILSSVAKLGSHINHRAKSDPRIIKMLEVSETISYRLQSIAKMQMDFLTDIASARKQDKEILGKYWNALEKKRNQELEDGKLIIDDDLKTKLYEVDLIKSELSQLLSLTEKLAKVKSAK